jgi:His/Glu/Gln/Arg/opine family amino acid ABC transporter permease subunit
MTWDWQVFLQDTGGGQTYLDWMLSAWGWTLAVAFLALLIALVFGALVGTVRTLPNHRLSFRLAIGAGHAWVEIFRNVPLLVQIFIWYHVIPALVPAFKGLPGPCRHSVPAARPALCLHGAWHDNCPVLSAGDLADGVSHHHSATDFRVDEHH